MFKVTPFCSTYIIKEEVLDMRVSGMDMEVGIRPVEAEEIEEKD